MVIHLFVLYYFNDHVWVKWSHLFCASSVDCRDREGASFSIFENDTFSGGLPKSNERIILFALRDLTAETTMSGTNYDADNRLEELVWHHILISPKLAGNCQAKKSSLFLPPQAISKPVSPRWKIQYIPLLIISPI